MLACRASPNFGSAWARWRAVSQRQSCQYDYAYQAPCCALRIVAALVGPPSSLPNTPSPYVPTHHHHLLLFATGYVLFGKLWGWSGDIRGMGHTYTPLHARTFAPYSSDTWHILAHYDIDTPVWEWGSVGNVWAVSSDRRPLFFFSGPTEYFLFRPWLRRMGPGCVDVCGKFLFSTMNTTTHTRTPWYMGAPNAPRARHGLINERSWLPCMA